MRSFYLLLMIFFNLSAGPVAEAAQADLAGHPPAQKKSTTSKTSSKAKSPSRLGGQSRRSRQPNTKSKSTGTTSTCRDFYSDLFSQSTIKMRVVFGYKDARPARFVGDRHERLAFVQRLTRPCVSGQACGFVRSPENADLFAKDIQVEYGRKVRILIWVVNSSVGSDDEENRRDPLQTWRSHYALAAFDSGLRDADIVFYNGHSRFGGGPDFAPPHLNHAGEVDPDYYTNKKPGLRRLTDALQDSTKNEGDERQLKVLGLISCSSSQHFTDEIRKYSDVKLLSSKNLMYYSDALETSLAKISKILERKCL